MTGRPKGVPNVRLSIPMIRRIRELRALDLSAEAVRRVVVLDFGARPSCATIRALAPRPRRQAVAGTTGSDASHLPDLSVAR